MLHAGFNLWGAEICFVLSPRGRLAKLREVDIRVAIPVPTLLAERCALCSHGNADTNYSQSLYHCMPALFHLTFCGFALKLKNDSSWGGSTISRSPLLPRGFWLIIFSCRKWVHTSIQVCSANFMVHGWSAGYIQGIRKGSVIIINTIAYFSEGK